MKPYGIIYRKRWYNLINYIIDKLIFDKLKTTEHGSQIKNHQIRLLQSVC
jgi:hypothetical protein